MPGSLFALINAISQSLSLPDLQDADRARLELFKEGMSIGRVKLLKSEEHGWIIQAGKYLEKQLKVEVKDLSQK